MQHMLRTVRIIQIKQRRLRERIRLALRHRVLRIPIHLDRPERIRLDQHRNRARRERIRRRKVHRLAQHQVFRLLHIRKNRLIRLLRATRQASQSQRSAHHLQKAAPAHRIDPLVRARLPQETPRASTHGTQASQPAHPDSSRSAARSCRPAWRGPPPASSSLVQSASPLRVVLRVLSSQPSSAQFQSQS